MRTVIGTRPLVARRPAPPGNTTPAEPINGDPITRPQPLDAPPQPAQAPCGDRVAVRVWQPQVRIIHWALVASIVVLSLTGLYIATPVLTPGRHIEIMAYARAIHIGTAFVFIGLLVWRVVLAFTGNRYARWHQFLPVRREQRGQIVPALRFYLFLTRKPPEVVGHNPLAGMTYTVLFAMLTVEAVTGLALEAMHQRGGWMWLVSGWVFRLAPAGVIRLVHHLILWLIWGFVVHHVYSAVLMDHVERSGVVSSMLSGWKSVRKDRT